MRIPVALRGLQALQEKRETADRLRAPSQAACPRLAAALHGRAETRLGQGALLRNEGDA